MSASGRYSYADAGGDVFKATARVDSGPAYFDFFYNAVPEPASWALMLLGFGLVGSSARKRKISFA